MAKIDENQEAIARIRTEVDKYDENNRRRLLKDADPEEVPEPAEEARCSNWKLGAPDRATTAKKLEENVFSGRTGEIYKKFAYHLKNFLLQVSPGCLSQTEDLKV